MSRISDLTALTGANSADGDLVRLVDVSDTTAAASGTDKRMTLAELRKALGETVILLGSNATANSTTTATEVTGLQATLAAGTYKFEYNVIYQSGATTTGVKMSVNFTGTQTTFVATQRYTGTGAAASTGAASMAGAGATGHVYEAFGRRSPSNAGWGVTVSVDAANSNMLMVLEGIIVVTVSGDLELWHGSEVAASSQVMAGSSLILTKLA